MTEAEWLASADTVAMLEGLAGVPSLRRLRLFACACCRRVEHLLTDQRSRATIRVTERYADGEADDDQLAEVTASAEAAFAEIPWLPNSQPTPSKLLTSAVWGATSRTEETCFQGHPSVGFAIITAIQIADASDTQEAERAAQADLIRDIFGNPFRPVAFDPAWRTEAVVALARGAYDDRAFNRLPVLADALDDAGCADADVLAHCRSAGPHVRGCWVVDLILGKT